jgi:hypothetical protein
LAGFAHHAGLGPRQFVHCFAFREFSGVSRPRLPGAPNRLAPGLQRLEEGPP